MTRDDIIRMAREAGFNVEQGFLLRVTGIDEDLERFAKLVAKHLCEKRLSDPLDIKDQRDFFHHSRLSACKFLPDSTIR